MATLLVLSPPTMANAAVLQMQVFFAVLIGAFSIGQAAPNFDKLITAAGASIAIYPVLSKASPQPAKTVTTCITQRMINTRLPQPTLSHLQSGLHQLIEQSMLDDEYICHYWLKLCILVKQEKILNCLLPISED